MFLGEWQIVNTRKCLVSTSKFMEYFPLYPQSYKHITTARTTFLSAVVVSNRFSHCVYSLMHWGGGSIEKLSMKFNFRHSGGLSQSLVSDTRPGLAISRLPVNYRLTREEQWVESCQEKKRWFPLSLTNKYEHRQLVATFTLFSTNFAMFGSLVMKVWHHQSSEN